MSMFTIFVVVVDVVFVFVLENNILKLVDFYFSIQYTQRVQGYGQIFSFLNFILFCFVQLLLKHCHQSNVYREKKISFIYSIKSNDQFDRINKFSSID